MKVAVFNLSGKQVGHVTLESELWEGAVRMQILSQAIAAYRTNLRAGRASTKRRGEVSGGGKKPWRQKHTGRARAGSIRSPLWRGGGSIFGPKPRRMRQALPQAIRRQALLESLKGKRKDEELVVLEGLSAEVPRTKPFSGLAKTFKVTGKSLIVLDGRPDPLVKSLRNLAKFSLRSAQNVNALDVLNAQKVLVAKDAVTQLEERVTGGEVSGTRADGEKGSGTWAE